MSDFLPEERAYEPRGAARALWDCRDKEVLLDGPAGTGKTRAILEKIHAACMNYPGARWLILRKTRTSMTESVLATFEDKVVEAGCSILDGASRQNRFSYEYDNGSKIVVGGMDRPDRIISTDYDGLAAFEATELSVDDWEKATSRIDRGGAMPYSQAIADCNPQAKGHWLNQRANTLMTRLLSRHEDNPLLWDKGDWTAIGRGYIERLDRLTGVRLQRLRYGRWAQAEGIVYENYDAAIHIIDRFEVPSQWRRIRAVDFGFTNPFVCQWWAIDPDGRAYRYREIYHTKRTVAEHAGTIRTYSQGERYEATVSDHDAEDRATLDREGIPTCPADKAIMPGIQAMTHRLAIAGDGRPRLFFMRDSLIERDESLAEAGLPWCTEQEFDGYMWPKNVEGKAIKEVPVDKDNHGMDASRYAAMFLDSGNIPMLTAIGPKSVRDEACESGREWLSVENEELWSSV